MRNLSILIPYRSDGGRRELLFGWVKRRYERLFPEAEIVVGRNEDQPFNRGAARNDAFKRSTGDMLLIADADVVCDVNLVWRAVCMTTRGRRWMIPYSTYYNLDKVTSDRIVAGAPETPVPPEDRLGYDHKLSAAVAGQLVVPRVAYEEVGGYDERYVGWGYEDTDFAITLNTLWAPVERLDGRCLHLWHDVTNANFEQPMIQVNMNLHRQYEKCKGNALRMREWIRGRQL